MAKRKPFNSITGKAKRKGRQALQHNVVVRVVGVGDNKRLILTVDLTKNIGTSRTGQSITIATSGGCKKVPDVRHDIKYNLNVFMPIDNGRLEINE